MRFYRVLDTTILPNKGVFSFYVSGPRAGLKCGNLEKIKTYFFILFILARPGRFSSKKTKNIKNKKAQKSSPDAGYQIQQFEKITMFFNFSIILFPMVYIIKNSHSYGILVYDLANFSDFFVLFCLFFFFYPAVRIITFGPET